MCQSISASRELGLGKLHRLFEQPLLCSGQWILGHWTGQLHDDHEDQPLRGTPHDQGLGAYSRTLLVVQPKKRKSGIPTGHAGEYFVMGELLRRGFNAQLADRNTQGYDVLVGTAQEPSLRKVQVKTVRVEPWYVSQADFAGERADLMTVYVLLGAESGAKPVRYFIARNGAVAQHVHIPSTGRWKDNAFMPVKALLAYEGRWETLLSK